MQPQFKVIPILSNVPNRSYIKHCETDKKYRAFINKLYYNRKTNHKQIYEESNLKMYVCPECKDVFGNFRNSQGVIESEHYPRFPRRGKDDKVCTQCEKAVKNG